MLTRRSPGCFLRCALFTLFLAGAGAATAADRGVEVKTASAPVGTDARIKLALSDAIRTQVGQAGLTNKLRGYSILPALIQLRQVAKPGKDQPNLVCVVELSLQHAQRGWVANVRGNASSLGASQLDTVYAAAHAAVGQLPATLTALQSR